jgi:S-adenosylmethionine synthetase
LDEAISQMDIEAVRDITLSLVSMAANQTPNKVKVQIYLRCLKGAKKWLDEAIRQMDVEAVRDITISLVSMAANQTPNKVSYPHLFNKAGQRPRRGWMRPSDRWM